MGKFTAVLIVGLVAAHALAGFGHGRGADAGAADFSRNPGGYQGTGGEFRIMEASPGSLRLPLATYAPATRGNDGLRMYFQSFCIERSDSYSSQARLWLSTEARYGGPGSHAWQDGHEPLEGTANGTDLDSKTAWAYSQFAQGDLAGYNYGAGGYKGLTRSQTAGALQRLIWASEGVGGSSYDADFGGISLNADQRALIQTWDSAYALAVFKGWTGIGNVRVLQMYDADGSDLRQDCLVLIVPTPGATPLAVMGLSLLTALRRR